MFLKFTNKLQSKAIRAAFWVFMGFGAAKFIQLASNLILTRILFPEAFGMMVIVNTVIIGLSMFSDIGLKPAVIQHPRGDSTAFLNTAWSVQVIRGFILFGVACLISWPIALLYKQPLLTSLICACATTALIKGFNSISIASAERHMELKRVTLMEVSTQFISAIIMISLAYLMKSVWALVIGNIMAALIMTLLSHRHLKPHSHRFKIEPQSWKELKQFGRWILGSTLLTFLGGHGMKAIEAIFIPLSSVAFLQIATMMTLSITEVMSALQAKILFPKLSQIQRNKPSQLFETFRRIKRKLLLLPLIGLSMLTLLSQWIIEVLYDDRYIISGKYLALYALGGFVTVLVEMYKGALLAKGKSKESFYIGMVDVIFKLTGLIIGFYLAGIYGMILGTISMGLISYFMTAYFAIKDGIFSLPEDITYFALAIAITILSAMINFSDQVSKATAVL